MRHLVFIALIVLVSCSKSVDKLATSTTTTNDGAHGEQKCDFGITQFNLSKRAPLNNEVPAKRPVRTGGDGGGTTPPTTGGTTTTTTNTTGGGVIYLDFDGQVVSNTSWNYSGDINCAPANLTTQQMVEILARVSNDYSPFNIEVTTDEATYNAANIYKRMRVIVTESWEWYGQTGGVSYTGSFTWGNNTPCFVFSSLLSYNTKNISEAAAHEAGHTLGLRHQATYDANGVLTSSYNYGAGSGEIGWAPIMGAGYYRNLSVWHNGPTSSGATSYQDDVAIISSVVGKKTDDFGDSYSSATTLSGSVEGTINTTTDVDFFAVDLSYTRTISVVPFNVGAANAGADVDLLLKVYNEQGQLIGSYNDVNTLNISTTLNAGRYYLAVSSTPNQYATTYGMLGKYAVNVL